MKKYMIAGIIVILFLVGISGCLKQESNGDEQIGGDNQPTNGNTGTTIPVYAGGTDFSFPDDIKTRFGILANATCSGYMTDDDARDVMSWYKAHMSSWILSNETNFTSPDQPQTTIYMQYYRNNENGAYILAASNFTYGKTMFGIVTGSWYLIQQCGPHPSFDEEPGGENPPSEPEDADWSSAYIFTDPAEDFWLGDGSPPQIINFPSSDFINVSVTNDAQYLYLKFVMNGDIPTLPLDENGDVVRILSMDLIIDIDRDTSTGNVMNSNGGEYALEAWFGSPPEAYGNQYVFVHYTSYNPAGEEGVGEWRDGTLVAGGSGYNFVTIKFQLEDLNLEQGMSVNVFMAVEAESDSYHHYARDVVGSDNQWYGPVMIQ